MSKPDKKGPSLDPDLAPLEVSVLAAKLKAQSSSRAHVGPKSGAELWQRCKLHFLQVAEFPFAIVAVATQTALNVVSGVGGYFVRPSKEEFENAAEIAESKHRETNERPTPEKDTTSAIASKPSESQLDKSLEKTQRLLSELKESGLVVEMRDVGNGRICLFLVPPESLDTAVEIVEQKTIPKLEVEATLDDGSSDLDGPCASLDLGLTSLGALQKLNVRTIRQLIRLSAEDLLAIEGFGEKSLGEVRHQLMFLGLKLNGD